MRDDKEAFMTRALALSDLSVAAGNHPFGAVLVRGGKIILEAKNTVLSENDATCHAEMNLVRLACRELSVDKRATTTLYTSTEPCAMCAGAIYWAGIGQIVYGCSAARLNEIAGASLACHCQEIYQGAVDAPKVQGPVLEDNAVQQHLDYWTTAWNAE
ncbi:nucleoside deaminase [Paremcibacter congregatus]|nr:nucleoside deaminase [Paremcibacter congregatus]